MYQGKNGTQVYVTWEGYAVPFLYYSSWEGRHRYIASVKKRGPCEISERVESPLPVISKLKHAFFDISPS